MYIIPNKTHYHNEYTRIMNRVPDPTSFQFEASKRMACYQRLYFEFEYTKKVNGLTFYYTCTYNNKSIPLYLGYPVFSYKDIRYVTNGKLSKWLLRQYGAKLKYFCACESGDGKGKRGLGNNPHLHFIFFVQPANDPKYKYIQIPPQVFDNWIKDIWQGKHTYIPFQKAKFGICREGKYGNVVRNIAAFRYVGKYVLKDDQQFEALKVAREHFEQEWFARGIDTLCFWCYYHYGNFDKASFMDDFDLVRYHKFYKRNRDNFPNYTYAQYVKEFGMPWTKVAYSKLEVWYREFYKYWYVKEKMSWFMSEHSGKVRCSKSLGEYGLQFIQNIDSRPYFMVPHRSGLKSERPCLYYIRHLYYDVKICPHSGSPLYVLTELGKQVKVNMLPYHCRKLEETLRSAFTYQQNNPGDFPSLLKPWITFNTDFMNSFISRPDIDYCIRLYTVFKNVYEFRHYERGKFFLSDELDFSAVLKDYAEFLKYDAFVLDYDLVTIYHVNFNRFEYSSFSEHPLFNCYAQIFDFFDSLIDRVSDCISKGKKQEFAERSDHQKRLCSDQFDLLDSFHIGATPSFEVGPQLMV